MIKSIMVPIEGDDGNPARIGAAVALARRFDAHVVGLHILPTLEYLMKTVPYMAYPVEVFTEEHEKMQARAEELWKDFDHTMSHEGILHERHQVEGDRMHFLNFYSRCSDLTVISQGKGNYKDMTSKMTSFMLETGLPVLAVPEERPIEVIGENILIAWNNSAQAARATHFALPLLKKAEKVTLLCIGEYGKKAVPAADIATHLARHDVNVETAQHNDSDIPEDIVLATAREKGADMIVAGAWGHSRITEIIMGGMTKSLLANQELPVFFAH